MFDEIKRHITQANRIAIFTHINPDGDALGSAYALETALRDIGKCAQVFLECDCTKKLCNLIKTKDKSNLSIDDCDLKIAVDCADSKRLGDMKKHFENNSEKPAVTVAIDHHITHIPFAAATFVDGQAASCGEVIYRLLKDMDLEITQDIAHNLYVAIASDTGGFKYASVCGDTYRIAAELVDKGVDFTKICRELFDTVTIEYLNLEKAAIDKIKLHFDGKAAVLVLTDEDFKKANVKETDADEIVNLPRSIKGVEVGVYIRERGRDKDKSKYKVSLRSINVDVSQIALKRDGGGHIHASGYSAEGDIEKICDELLSDISELLGGDNDKCDN